MNKKGISSGVVHSVPADLRKVLVSFPTVDKDRVTPKVKGDFELVKYASGPERVRSIFNPPFVLKCPEIAPADLKLEAIVGDVAAFSSGAITFFAKKGQNLRSKMGQPIAGYTQLKLLDIKAAEKKVVLQNSAATIESAECASMKNFQMR